MILPFGSRSGEKSLGLMRVTPQRSWQGQEFDGMALLRTNPVERADGNQDPTPGRGCPPGGPALRCAAKGPGRHGVLELGADVYEVEFSDNEGKTYALTALPSCCLLRLEHEPAGGMCLFLGRSE